MEGTDSPSGGTLASPPPPPPPLPLPGAPNTQSGKDVVSEVKV